MTDISEMDYLPRVHADLLLIMDEIHRVCEKNRIRYYLVAGSLLGAVRHKGFIPWDDDLDIGMPRADLDRFIRIASKELRPPFKLEWITTDQQYYRLFAKVVNTNTAFYEQRACGTTSKLGLFVDIFPLDLTKGYNRRLETRKFFIKKIGGMLSVKGIKGSLKGIEGFVTEMMPRKLLYSMARRLMTVGSGSGKADHYTNFASQYAVRRQTMPVEIYGEGTMISFEGHEYCAPERWQEYLTRLYGPKYMELPPVEKRRSHYPLYVRFENGTEMRFDRPDHKVTIEETLS